MDARSSRNRAIVVLLALLIATALLGWPGASRGSGRPWLILPIAAGTAALLLACPWRRARVALAVAAVAAAAWALPFVFHGSLDWFDVSIRYGAEKFTGLDILSTSLAGILNQTYHWSPDEIAFTLAGRPVTIKWALQLLFALCLLLSAVGLARHDRYGDRRFLIAVAAPWVCFFAFAPMMHERYLLWGAAIATSIGIADSVGVALLGLVATGISLGQQLNQLFGDHAGEFGNGVFPGFGRWLQAAIGPAVPGLGWAAMLLAAALLYLALAPTPWRGRSRRPQ